MSLPLPEKRLLTSDEAASYCGFNSVNGFLAHIRVSPVKFGKVVRYDRTDLDAFLDTFRQSAPRRKISELAGNAGEGRGH
jgi:hypothetical protein